jgi:hypothetical protein
MAVSSTSFWRRIDPWGTSFQKVYDEDEGKMGKKEEDIWNMTK